MHQALLYVRNSGQHIPSARNIAPNTSSLSITAWFCSPLRYQFKFHFLEESFLLSPMAGSIFWRCHTTSSSGTHIISSDAQTTNLEVTYFSVILCHVRHQVMSIMPHYIFLLYPNCLSWFRPLSVPLYHISSLLSYKLLSVPSSKLAGWPFHSAHPNHHSLDRNCSLASIAFN